MLQKFLREQLQDLYKWFLHRTFRNTVKDPTRSFSSNAPKESFKINFEKSFSSPTLIFPVKSTEIVPKIPTMVLLGLPQAFPPFHWFLQFSYCFFPNLTLSISPRIKFIKNCPINSCKNDFSENWTKIF